MNKREKSLLTELYWYIQENKNEHHALYYSKDVLQSILRGEFGIAERLLKRKNSLTFLPKQSECSENPEHSPENRTHQRKTENVHKYK